MSVVTNLIQAETRDLKGTLEGKTLTRPALIYTDGISVTYAVDVDIGQEGPINENGDLGMLPLRNVPIAANNRELYYADVGQAVILTKSTLGHWEVTGFGKTAPGVFRIVPVTLPDYCYGSGEVQIPEVGVPEELSVAVRNLTYEELSIYGTYGETPYGAIGEFENGELVAIRS